MARNAKSEWVDPWTLERQLDDYYENCYPYESSTESDEFISYMEDKIKMAYNDIELLYEVID